MKIRHTLTALALILAVSQAMAVDRDFRYREASPTSVIEDTMCITALNSDTCLHVDEDVPNLIIEVLGPNGVLIKSFSCTADCEDISVLGTFATPTADSVRVMPQGNDTGDYTQMMFENVVYDGYAWVEICVTDGNATIDDFCRFVYLDGVSSKDVGLIRKGGVDTATTQQQLAVDIDFTDDDVLLGNTITLEDTSTGEIVSRWITNINATTDSVTYNAAPEFTIDDTDIVRIYADVHPQYLLLQNQVDIEAKVDTVDTEVGVIDGLVDAIKAITDQFVFSITGEVDANTKSVNDCEVTGDGNAVPWNSAC